MWEAGGAAVAVRLPAEQPVTDARLICLRVRAQLVSWYDNEWGYSNRVVDLAAYIATKDALVKA